MYLVPVPNNWYQSDVGEVGGYCTIGVAVSGLKGVIVFSVTQKSTIKDLFLVCRNG